MPAAASSTPASCFSSTPRYETGGRGGGGMLYTVRRVLFTHALKGISAFKKS